MNTRRRSGLTSLPPETHFSDHEPIHNHPSPLGNCSATYDAKSIHSSNKSTTGNMDSLEAPGAECASRCLRSRNTSSSANDCPPHLSARGTAELDCLSPATRQRIHHKRRRRPSKVIPICGLCLGTSELNNRTNSAEDLIACWECGQSGHPSCLQMPPDLIRRIVNLRWRCVDCKRCCLCQPMTKDDISSDKEESQSDLLLCDICDRGFHLKCVDPNLSEPPEGMWSCPICSTNSDGSKNVLSPHLQELSEDDELTQSEIDWMRRNLNAQTFQHLSPLSTSSTELKKSDDPTSPKRTSHKSANSPASPKVRNTDNTLARRTSKKLVQKSLTGWTIKSRSPQKVLNTDKRLDPAYKNEIKQDSSGRSIRPRRTSIVASAAWYPLIKTCGKSRVNAFRARVTENASSAEGNEEDDDDKTDILTNDTLPSTALPKVKSDNEAIKDKASSKTCSLKRSALMASLAQVRTQNFKGVKKMKICRSKSSNKCQTSIDSIISGRQKTLDKALTSPVKSTKQTNQLKQHQLWKSSQSNLKRGYRSSALQRWCRGNMHSRGSKFPYGKRRGLSGRILRQTVSTRLQSFPKKNSLPTFLDDEMSDTSTSSGDDNSSETVAAAQDENDPTIGRQKSNGSSAHLFDSENDESPEFGTITEDSRSLFSLIQADVQASLPQPLESSLALPPANNPKLLSNIDSNALVTNGSTHHSNDTSALDKINDESRYPPQIQFGRYIITTWYSAPYPSEYARLNLLYICEFCLKYMKTRKVYLKHIEKCPFSFPPGNEIYRSGEISVFEVDGYTSRLYCQQLCLLAKLFLDHKTLYYDVEPFLFYVLTVREDQCFHLVGYFSKEKRSAQKYNLSCIMVLPPYQKHAYGRFLIDFSFLLSRIEGQPGSPEKPLSELGLLAYESYWRSKVLPYVLRSVIGSNDNINSNHCVNGYKDRVVTIHDITAATGIDPHDVANTIQQLATAITLTADARPLLCFNESELVKIQAKYESRSKTWIQIDDECLRWSPLIHPQETDASGESAGEQGNSTSQTIGPTSPKTTPRSMLQCYSIDQSNTEVDYTGVQKSIDYPPSSHLDDNNDSTANNVRRRNLRSSSGPVPSYNSNRASSPQNITSQKSVVDVPMTAPTSLATRRRTSLRSPLNLTQDANSVDTTNQRSHLSPIVETSFGRLRSNRNSSYLSPDSSILNRKSDASSNPKNSMSPNENCDTNESANDPKVSKTRAHPSPCRKKLPFNKGPPPPDPPPSQGRSNAQSSSNSAGNERSCRGSRSESSGKENMTKTTINGKQNVCSKAATNSFVPGAFNTTSNDLFPNRNKPPNMELNVAMTSEVEFLVNSSEMSPLRPSYSSSPRARIERSSNILLNTTAAKTSRNESVYSSASLSPSPPMLSLADGISVLEVDPLSKNDLSTIKPIVDKNSIPNVTNAAPPCLSIYDSENLLTIGVAPPPIDQVLGQGKTRRHSHPCASPTYLEPKNISLTPSLSSPSLVTLPMDCMKFPTSCSVKVDAGIRLPLFVDTNLDEELDSPGSASISTSYAPFLPSNPTLNVASSAKCSSLGGSHSSLGHLSRKSDTDKFTEPNPCISPAISNPIPISVRRRCLSLTSLQIPKDMEQNLSVKFYSLAAFTSTPPPVLRRVPNLNSSVSPPALMNECVATLSTSKCGILHSPLPPLLITANRAAPSGSTSPQSAPASSNNSPVEPPLLFPFHPSETAFPVLSMESKSQSYGLHSVRPSSRDSRTTECDCFSESDQSSAFTIPMCSGSVPDFSDENLTELSLSMIPQQCSVSDAENMTVLATEYNDASSDASSQTVSLLSPNSRQSSEETLPMRLNASSPLFFDDSIRDQNLFGQTLEPVDSLLNVNTFLEYSCTNETQANSSDRKRHHSVPSCFRSSSTFGLPRRCHSYPKSLTLLTVIHDTGFIANVQESYSDSNIQSLQVLATLNTHSPVHTYKPSDLSCTKLSVCVNPKPNEMVESASLTHVETCPQPENNITCTSPDEADDVSDGLKSHITASMDIDTDDHPVNKNSSDSKSPKFPASEDKVPKDSILPEVSHPSEKYDLPHFPDSNSPHNSPEPEISPRLVNETINGSTETVCLPLPQQYDHNQAMVPQILIPETVTEGPTPEYTKPISYEEANQEHKSIISLSTTPKPDLESIPPSKSGMKLESNPSVSFEKPLSPRIPSFPPQIPSSGPCIDSFSAAQPDFAATELTHLDKSETSFSSFLMPVKNDRNSCGADELLSESSNFVSPAADKLIADSNCYSGSMLSAMLEHPDFGVAPSVDLNPPQFHSPKAPTVLSTNYCSDVLQPHTSSCQLDFVSVMSRLESSTPNSRVTKSMSNPNPPCCNLFPLTPTKAKRRESVPKSNARTARNRSSAHIAPVSSLAMPWPTEVSVERRRHLSCQTTSLNTSTYNVTVGCFSPQHALNSTPYSTHAPNPMPLGSAAPLAPQAVCHELYVPSSDQSRNNDLLRIQTSYCITPGAPYNSGGGVPRYDNHPSYSLQTEPFGMGKPAESNVPHLSPQVNIPSVCPPHIQSPFSSPCPLSSPFSCTTNLGRPIYSVNPCASMTACPTPDLSVGQIQSGTFFPIYDAQSFAPDGLRVNNTVPSYSNEPVFCKSNQIPLQSPGSIISGTNVVNPLPNSFVVNPNYQNFSQNTIPNPHMSSSPASAVTMLSEPRSCDRQIPFPSSDSSVFHSHCAPFSDPSMAYMGQPPSHVIFYPQLFFDSTGEPIPDSFSPFPTDNRSLSSVETYHKDYQLSLLDPLSAQNSLTWAGPELVPGTHLAPASYHPMPI